MTNKGGIYLRNPHSGGSLCNRAVRTSASGRAVASASATSGATVSSLPKSPAAASEDRNMTGDVAAVVGGKHATVLQGACVTCRSPAPRQSPERPQACRDEWFAGSQQERKLLLAAGQGAPGEQGEQGGVAYRLRHCASAAGSSLSIAPMGRPPRITLIEERAPPASAGDV